MSAPQSIPELVRAAKDDAKIHLDRIAALATERASPQTEEARGVAIGALEHIAVDLFTVFEARMQHHFKRGPFSRKLKAVLLDAGHTDLAARLHTSYLAVNVLKHEKGASYRELLAAQSPLLTAPDPDANETDTPASLIDVTTPGFLDTLTTTILEAYTFLEQR
ncbi:hypothetical protein [Celeribacter marinus]|uniref:hypothetical protein n=1 Tax=Celeribacter marinus TaxID=1397108 RepID=UPI003F6D1DAF